MATTDGLATGPPREVQPAPESARLQPGTVKQELAAETLRLYAGDWARFQAYCAAHGEKALPASPALVAGFLMAPGGHRAALARRLAAIDYQHRRHGLPPPGGDRELRAILRQARRVTPRRVRAAAPTPAALTQLAETCRGDPVGRRDRALLLLLAAGLGRRAVVALRAEQLRFAEPGVTLAPARAEETPLHLARAATVASCPVRALEAWLQHSDTRYGPVFRKINRWGRLEHDALGADAIRLILARRATALPWGRRS